MKKIIQDLEIVGKKWLNSYSFLIDLQAPEKLPDMFPGQFAEVLVENSRSTFLRRPFSIHNICYAENTISFLIQIVGDGTKALGELKEGDLLNIIYPLGNSFSLPFLKDKVLLVGGGCGAAPLLFLARYFFEKGISIIILMGGRTKEDIFEIEEYKKYGKVYIMTEDGTMGEKGLVTRHYILNSGSPEFNKIYTCGPEPMMKTIAVFAKENGLNCEVSLENTMACGIGACLCCVVETTTGNKCVCTEGPVFNINDLTW